VQLSLTERLILANQYRIMELIDPENAEGHALKQDALRSGYGLDIDDLVSEFAEGEDAFTAEECREVFDILDTFRALHRAYDALEDKSGIDEDDIRSEGFDANHEKQYHYAHHLRQQDKWEELMPHGAINSRHLTMDRYRPMAAAWKQIPSNRRHRLTKEDIQQIVAAGRG
jgi:uncharacterized protein YfbU (UPF0304 family)